MSTSGPGSEQSASGFNTTPDVQRMVELRNLAKRSFKELTPHSDVAWKNVVPLKTTAKREGIMEFGPADNAQIFAAFGGIGRGVLRSMLRNLNVPPFTQEVMDDHQLCPTGLIVASYICFLRSTDPTLRRQQLIQEVMASNLPEDQVMKTEDAQEKLTGLMRSVDLFKDASWFLDGVNHINRQYEKLEDKTHWSHYYNCEKREWNEERSLDQMLEYFTEIAKVSPDKSKNRVFGVLLLLVTSFAVRGSLSAPKLSRIVNDLKSVIPYIHEALTLSDLHLTWANFGHLVDDESMPGIMQRLLNQIPAPTIRLRVVLAQAVGSGLTSLDVIARAIHAHPHFPWTCVQRLYSGQWDAACKAIKLVGKNPYFGYRRDLQEVRSTLFKGLSSLCGKLLMAMGDRSLENYRGFVEDRINRDCIEKMIEAYVRTQGGVDLSADPSVDELQHRMAMLELVKDYPANIGGLASTVLKMSAVPSGGLMPITRKGQHSKSPLVVATPDITARLDNIEAQLAVMNATTQEILTGIKNLQAAGVRMMTHQRRYTRSYDDLM